MTPRNTLLQATPYPVESAINKVGENLRIARLRRKLTIAEVAEKIERKDEAKERPGGSPVARATRGSLISPPTVRRSVCRSQAKHGRIYRSAICRDFRAARSY